MWTRHRREVNRSAHLPSLGWYASNQSMFGGLAKRGCSVVRMIDLYVCGLTEMHAMLSWRLTYEAIYLS